jgi:hypothetical protein
MGIPSVRVADNSIVFWRRKEYALLKGDNFIVILLMKEAAFRLFVRRSICSPILFPQTTFHYVATKSTLYPLLSLVSYQTSYQLATAILQEKHVQVHRIRFLLRTQLRNNLLLRYLPRRRGPQRLSELWNILTLSDSEVPGVWGRKEGQECESEGKSCGMGRVAWLFLSRVVDQCNHKV